MMKYLGFILVLLLMVVCPANGQDTKTIVSGNIVDSLGAAIISVRISAKNKEGKVFTFNSNSDGSYILSLEPGIYELNFVKRPFETFKISEYQIPMVSKIHLDISLICKNCQMIHDYPAECDDCPAVKITLPGIEMVQGRAITSFVLYNEHDR